MSDPRIGQMVWWAASFWEVANIYCKRQTRYRVDLRNLDDFNDIEPKVSWSFCEEALMCGSCRGPMILEGEIDYLCRKCRAEI